MFAPATIKPEPATPLGGTVFAFALADYAREGGR